MRSNHYILWLLALVANVLKEHQQKKRGIRQSPKIFTAKILSGGQLVRGNNKFSFHFSRCLITFLLVESFLQPSLF